MFTRNPAYDAAAADIVAVGEIGDDTGNQEARPATAAAGGMPVHE
jgi:hypothetical protein